MGTENWNLILIQNSNDIIWFFFISQIDRCEFLCLWHSSGSHVHLFLFFCLSHFFMELPTSAYQNITQASHLSHGSNLQGCLLLWWWCIFHQHFWSIISLGNSLKSELWNKQTKPEKHLNITHSLPVSTQVYFFALLLNFIWCLSIIYEDSTQRYLPSPEYLIMFEFWLMIIQVFPTC